MGMPIEVVGDDATAISMRQQQIVEVVEETRRRRRICIWAGRIRQVEQFFALLATERHQLRSQHVDNFAQAGQAGPALHIRDRGGPERGEVTPHQILQSQVGLRVRA